MVFNSYPKYKPDLNKKVLVKINNNLPRQYYICTYRKNYDKSLEDDCVFSICNYAWDLDNGIIVGWMYLEELDCIPISDFGNNDTFEYRHISDNEKKKAIIEEMFKE